MLVRRVLTELQREYPDLRVESVDILIHPGKALRRRIKMIPTLQAGEQRLSSFFLGPAAIRAFIEQTLQSGHESKE